MSNLFLRLRPHPICSFNHASNLFKFVHVNVHVQFVSTSNSSKSNSVSMSNSFVQLLNRVSNSFAFTSTSNSSKSNSCPRLIRSFNRSIMRPICLRSRLICLFYRPIRLSTSNSFQFVHFVHGRIVVCSIRPIVHASNLFNSFVCVQFVHFIPICSRLHPIRSIRLCASNLFNSFQLFVRPICSIHSCPLRPRLICLRHGPICSSNSFVSPIRSRPIRPRPIPQIRLCPICFVQVIRVQFVSSKLFASNTFRPSRPSLSRPIHSFVPICLYPIRLFVLIRFASDFCCVCLFCL